MVEEKKETGAKSSLRNVLPTHNTEIMGKRQEEIWSRGKEQLKWKQWE